jgi:molecular chaperone DnaK (HSP70)
VHWGQSLLVLIPLSYAGWILCAAPGVHKQHKQMHASEVKDIAQGLIRNTQTLLESSVNVPQSDRNEVQQAVQALQNALRGADIGKIDTGNIMAKTEDLAQVSMKLR